MIIPVRCFTCGRVIASDFEAFKERFRAGEGAKKILDDLGLERYCCRRMIIGNADVLKEAAMYE